MTKNVTIDARWLVGGIGTYTRNLLQEFGRYANGFDIQAIVRERDSASVRKFCDDVAVVDVPIYTVLEQWAVARASRRCDLLHVPHFNAPLLHRGPLVVSIMDVIHLNSPAYRGNWSTLLYARPMLNAVARKAEHVVTVSKFSKDQIVQTLNIPPSRVTVIPCGVGKEFTATISRGKFHEVAQVLGLQLPFVLYVGNLKPHKNVKTLLRAFAQLRRTKRLPHSLLIVGDDLRWKSQIVEECTNLGLRDCTVFAPEVPQSLLPGIYASADLLVMPSTLEGFGLPVLEAMACGTPVVASSAGSLPEVAGDAALYFEPMSVDDLAVQVERVLGSPSQQKTMRDLGILRAKEFSWEKAARCHIELYGDVLGSH
jgi:glycosyltransferase involved in cell wall biosynthesis